jgi:beta-glucanase (GH16 family)
MGTHKVARGNISRRCFIVGTLALSAIVLAGGKDLPEYTFYDDFDGPAGSAPDPAKWTYDLGGGQTNDELEVYTNSRENSYVDGQSNLVIAATNSGGAYQSARLKTLGLFSQIGGHFEARIKINSQRGTWPAFWLLGQDMPTQGWPKCGEIDIMENFGYTDVFSSSVYTQKSGSATYAFGASIAGDGNWHVHRCDVDADGITFSLDDYEYGHCPSTYCPPASWVFGPGEPNNGGLFIVLNMAIGGNSSQSPPPASTKFPATMLVDYVRAWQ